MRFILFTLTFSLLAASSYAEDFHLSVDESGIVFKGQFDREAVRRSLNVIKTQFEKCKSDQPLRYSIEFQITPKGKARAVMFNGFPLPNDKANDCVAAILEKAKFPPSQKDSTDSVMIPVVVGNPPPIVEEKCETVNLKKNFENSCMDLNGLHLRSLGIPHMLNNFRVVCKCVEDNFDLKKLIQGDSCKFKSEDAFQLLKSRPVYVMCVQGR
jgi:hypothetical protein